MQDATIGRCPTLIDSLRKHAIRTPEKTAIVTLNGASSEIGRKTYGELFAEATVLARHLTNKSAAWNDGGKSDDSESSRTTAGSLNEVRFKPCPLCVTTTIWLCGRAAV